MKLADEISGHQSAKCYTLGGLIQTSNTFTSYALINSHIAVFNLVYNVCYSLKYILPLCVVSVSRDLFTLV